MLVHKLWASEASALGAGRPSGLCAAVSGLSQKSSHPRSRYGEPPPSSKGSLPGPRLVWSQEQEEGVSQPPFFGSTCF